MTDCPEPGDPFTDGLMFAAGATVLVGVMQLAGFAIAELLRRKDDKEIER